MINTETLSNGDSDKNIERTGEKVSIFRLRVEQILPPDTKFKQMSFANVFRFMCLSLYIPISPSLIVSVKKNERKRLQTKY